MKLLADKDLLLHSDMFPEDWLVVGKSGRDICNADVLDVDAVLVRSITRVDKKLLDGSRVKFIGTATAGLDHIDRAYLDSRGIYLSNAAGCNANAVTDYCMAAIAYCVLERNLELPGLTVGVIGAGNVGRRLVKKLQALGFKVCVYDPPLQSLANTGDVTFDFCSLEEIASCDVVSLHVPLVDAGLNPTRHMIAREFFSCMHEKSVLLNTCRGGVVDESALVEHLGNNPHCTAIVDVWNGEPAVNHDSIQAVHIATPHIAGYSARAKADAVRMISDGLSGYYGLAFSKSVELNSSKAGSESVSSCDESISQTAKAAILHSESCWQSVLGSLPLLELSQAFKRRLRNEECTAVFDDMRKRLVSRQEFQEIKLESSIPSAQRWFLRTVGFANDETAPGQC